MTAVSGHADDVLPRWRDPRAWEKVADIFAVLTAVVLPWSTSLVAIFITVWLVTACPTVEPRSFFRSLRQPVCALPLGLFLLALVGTLWSEAPWGARLYAVGPVAKLCAVPILFYYFERSSRGLWVFWGFFVSCALLMALSWAVTVEPRLVLKSHSDYGVPVKNYIDQSQEFALCAVAVIAPVCEMVRRGRHFLACIVSLVMLGFLANMVFVTVSRTALVSIPIMLLAFGMVHLKWRQTLLLIAAGCVVIGALWVTSSNLRTRVSNVLVQYNQYRLHGESSSVGLRLEFWRKSLLFVEEAPFFGHGTGSIRHLFELAAKPQSTLSPDGLGRASAEVIANPHNQILNVAVQWGLSGVVILLAMWLVHFQMFRGEGIVSWIGLLVVVQNVVGSLFNSHLFDFNEGWMYVLGVGIAGGVVARNRNNSCAWIMR